MLREKAFQFSNPVFRTQILPTVSQQELFCVDGKMKRLGVPLSQRVSELSAFIYQNLKYDYVAGETIFRVTAELFLVRAAATAGNSDTSCYGLFKSSLPPRQVIQSPEKLVGSCLLDYCIYYCANVYLPVYLSSDVQSMYSPLQQGLISVIESGFLGLENRVLDLYYKKEHFYWEYFHQDDTTTWRELYLNVASQLDVRDSRSQEDIRGRLILRIPNIVPFLEPERVTLTSRRCQSCTGTDERLTPESVKRVLLGVIHELQYQPRTTYKSVLDMEYGIFPQILAEMTSASPLYQAMVFAFSDSVAIDIRGMWRQAFTTVFDEILRSAEISDEVIKQIHEAGKFGKRKIDFTKLNRLNPHSNAVFRIVQNAQTEKPVAIPHYNGYTPVASSQVYPRLTEKRSCIYYFGRLLSFLLIYGGKMPNYLAEQFWRSLVGGRLFFDDELKKKYASEIKHNPMFEINGTKPLKELTYSMTLAQAKQNYGEWLDIWNMAQQSDCEVEMLCLNENIVR